MVRPKGRECVRHGRLKYGVFHMNVRFASFLTSGLVMRLFLMRWYQWSVEVFEKTQNPRNGAVVVMRQQTDGSYQLERDGGVLRMIRAEEEAAAGHGGWLPPSMPWME